MPMTREQVDSKYFQMFASLEARNRYPSAMLDPLESKATNLPAQHGRETDYLERNWKDGRNQ
jgi:hypothetical protein